MESDILKARILEAIKICQKSQKIKFLGFLTQEEAVFARQILKNVNVEFSFFGGYEAAERVYLAVLPEWAETLDFPINAVTFTYRNVDELTHRDFLGTLMGLGLKRESVGDILVEQGRAVAFLSDSVTEFVKSQLKTVGRKGVTLTDGFIFPLPEGSRLVECTDTVASARLDCIVAALANFSRNTAVLGIEEGRVFVNSVLCEKPTKTVNEGDIISIRGKGKFEIVSLSDLTRKNRLIFKYKKYV